LLDSDYLSLAEVQVMGVDPLHFAEVDYSSTQNDFGGFYNVNYETESPMKCGCKINALHKKKKTLCDTKRQGEPRRTNAQTDN
jgi:hypothetical protein